MEQELIKAFKKAKYEEDTVLAQNIWQSIVVRNKRNTLLRLWAFSVAGLASFMGLIPAWKALLNDLTQSGFYEYLSLAFSNGSSVSSYWKEFSLSIAEALPTMSILLSLSLIFIFFLSLKYVMKQIINNNPIGKTYGVVA
ncbi:MAG: hypothetical protein WC822_01895 [Candidatus Paceibacterota bacterium]|jgi:hypothetical protein